jgi:adenylate kinase
VNLLLIGPQGSGKGTQAKRIAEAYGIPHVSTGDMFRAAMAAGTDLGREVQAVHDAGRLVSDELTNEVVRARLAEPDVADGMILDGYPRNPGQAAALDEILAGLGAQLDAVLFFDLPDDVAMERMLARGRAEGRPDDTPEAIARRLELYHQQTEPLVELYRSRGMLVPVHAGGSVDAVYGEIEAALRLLEDESAA